MCGDTTTGPVASCSRAPPSVSMPACTSLRRCAEGSSSPSASSAGVYASRSCHTSATAVSRSPATACIAAASAPSPGCRRSTPPGQHAAGDAGEPLVVLVGHRVADQQPEPDADDGGGHDLLLQRGPSHPLHLADQQVDDSSSGAARSPRHLPLVFVAITARDEGHSQEGRRSLTAPHGWRRRWLDPPAMARWAQPAQPPEGTAAGEPPTASAPCAGGPAGPPLSLFGVARSRRSQPRAYASAHPSPGPFP